MSFEMSYNTVLKDIQEVKKLLDLFKNPKGLVLVYDINGKVFKLFCEKRNYAIS